MFLVKEIKWVIPAMEQEKGLRAEGSQPGNIPWLMGMGLMLVLSMLPYVSFAAVAPLVQRDWHLNNTQVGFIFSAFMVGYALSSLFILPLTDRVGCRWLMLSCLLLSAGGHLLFPLVAQGVVSGVLVRLLPGVGLVGIYMPALRLIAGRFPFRGRGAAMGAFVSAAYVGSSLSLALTGALISEMGWRGAYMMVSLLSLLSVPLGVWVVPRESAPAGQATLRLGVLRQGGVRLMAIGYGIHNWELFAARAWLAPYLVGVLVRRGMETEGAAAVASAAAAALFAPGIAGPFLGGTLSDRLGRARAAALVLSVSGACSLVIGWLAGVPWGLLVALGLLYGLALAADSSIYTTGIADFAQPQWLGSAMAVQAFIGFGAGLLAPVAYGAILDLAPPHLSWGMAFASGGAVSFLGVAAMLFLRRRERLLRPSG